MPVGPIYTWVDPRTQPECIADIIHLVDWKEAPLLNILGFGSGNVERLIPNSPWPAKKAVWFNDTLPPNETTLTADITGTTTFLPVELLEGLYFREGDILAALDADDAILEYVEVVGTTGSAITVARDYPAKSGTGVVINNGAKLRRVTRMAAEMSSSNPSFVTEVGESYNWVQIIEDTVPVSRTAEKVVGIGYESQMDRRIKKRFVNNGTAGTLLQELEATFFHDLRKARTTEEKGSMGGMDTFVTSNLLDVGGSALSEDHIREVIRAILSGGGTLDFMLMSMKTRDYMDKLYEGRIQSTIDTDRGGSAIEYVRTSNGGDVMMISHLKCPDNQIRFVNRHECGWIPLDPFFVEDVDNDEDGKRRRVIGEYTFVLTHEAHFGKIHNFDYS